MDELGGKIITGIVIAVLIFILQSTGVHRLIASMFGGASAPLMEDMLSSTTKKEELFWVSIDKCGTDKCYQLYLEKYPQGNFSSIAKIQIKSDTTNSNTPRLEKKSAIKKEITEKNNIDNFNDVLSLYNNGEYSSKGITLLSPSLAENASVVPISISGEIQTNNKLWLSTNETLHIEAINTSGVVLKSYNARLKIDKATKLFGFIENNSNILATSNTIKVPKNSLQYEHDQYFDIHKWIDKIDNSKKYNGSNKFKLRLELRLKSRNLNIKIITGHPMETGFRKNGRTGENIQKNFIEAVGIYLNGEPLIYSQWGSSVSKNPYLSVTFENIGKIGDVVKIIQITNSGVILTAEKKIK